MPELPDATSTSLLDLSIQYSKAGDAAYARAFAAYENAGLRLHRSMNLLAVAGLAAVVGIVLVVISLAVPTHTLHTRRVTVGDRTVTLEIPDGQCAEALGVRVCVPVSSAPSSPGKVSP